MVLTNFVRKNYTLFFEICLWLSLIIFIIIGGLTGAGVGILAKPLGNVFPFLIVIGPFLGIIIGFIFGIIFIVIFGGFSAILLNYYNNISNISYNLKMLNNNTKYLMNNEKSLDLIGTNNKNKEIENENLNNENNKSINNTTYYKNGRITWNCPKCGNENPNNTFKCEKCKYSLI